MTVSEYIRLNWKNTIRKPKDMKGGFTPPKPFISPSIGGYTLICIIGTCILQTLDF